MENRRVKSDTTIVIYDQIQLLCASLRFDVKYNPIAEKSFSENVRKREETGQAEASMRQAPVNCL